ncbi:EF-hand domain-containing protein [Brevundimonas faecalis]|uniref:EF-hand domain-containing protein n=1 Tax=Brevundimonas faecalis TaxID=947378 RepID=UPI003613F7FE
MTRQRSPKKSETIEIRLPFTTKAAFIARCRDDGRTVSEAVRGFIDSDLAQTLPASSSPLRGWPMLAAAAAGLALGAAAAPSLAETKPASPAAFIQLDSNHDGVLSFDEFRRRN